MKNSMLILIALLFSQISYGQSDTLNYRDSLGNKQGYWIVYGCDKPDSKYCDTCKVGEGNYTDDRKNGRWIKYHIDGVHVKLIGDYANGRPKGPFTKVGHPGNLKEHNYYKSDCPKHKFNFNENGEQQGVNILYYDCDSTHETIGQIEVIFKIENGVKVDTQFRYYRNGDLKQMAVYDYEGRVSEIMNYDRINPSAEPIYTGKPKPCECPDLKNEDDELLFDGKCKDGKIWEGKKYIYDSDGILLKIQVWKKGRYVSDAVL